VKVEYDKIAQHYDSHRYGGGPYLDGLVALAGRGMVNSAVDVLEVGAGTGNNTESFLDAYPCRLRALDLSCAMLSKAKGKGLSAAWIQANVEHIPLADGSVEFLFGVYVLHHLGDLEKVFRECARVLRHGYAAFVTASPEFIESHPMNCYFPSFSAIDKARFQPIETIRDAFLRAGFEETGADQHIDRPRPIGPEYVARVENKFISTYDLLPPDEFAAGLDRLKADVAKTGRLECDIVWESVTVWARK